jgi:two-component system cell cycle sensor histidine kinase/response regulator CckA
MTIIENNHSPAQTGVLPEQANGEQIHILVVDDDLVFQSLLQLALETFGYAATVVGSGKAALEAAAQHKDLQLLITDITMPGMSGAALAERLRETYPRLKVLFISGYPKTAIPSMAVPAGSIHFLQKPFRPPQLMDSIKTILAEPGGD